MLQVRQRLLVDREEAARRAVLGRHVRDRRAVGDREADEPGAEVLDELPDDAERAQDLGHREDEVGRGRALGQRAGEPESDDLGDEHRHGLAEQRGLGLDPADAPAEHAEAVHHRRVRVGADERVGEGLQSRSRRALDHAREVLEVHLVADAGVRRRDLEVREGALAPAQEGVALAVSLVVAIDVRADRAGAFANSSTCTEWSITSSAGMSGLTFAGSPPRSSIASRIAARSTIAGTPVKSCRRTRAGRKEISREGSAAAIPRRDRLDVGVVSVRAARSRAARAACTGAGGRRSGTGGCRAGRSRAPRRPPRSSPEPAREARLRPSSGLLVSCVLPLCCTSSRGVRVEEAAPASPIVDLVSEHAGHDHAQVREDADERHLGIALALILGLMVVQVVVGIAATRSRSSPTRLTCSRMRVR